MNMSSALGTSCAKVSFDEYYTRAVEYLGGAKEVGKYLPVGLDEIRKKLRKDKHLNNIPLHKWDTAAGFCRKIRRNVGEEFTPTGYGLWCLLRKHGITMASPSECVCILKMAAKMLASETQNDSAGQVT